MHVLEDRNVHLKSKLNNNKNRRAVHVFMCVNFEIVWSKSSSNVLISICVLVIDVGTSHTLLGIILVTSRDQTDHVSCS